MILEIERPGGHTVEVVMSDDSLHKLHTSIQDTEYVELHFVLHGRVHKMWCSLSDLGWDETASPKTGVPA